LSLFFVLVICGAGRIELNLLFVLSFLSLHHLLLVVFFLAPSHIFRLLLERALHVVLL
jgi:hypothetical protein